MPDLIFLDVASSTGVADGPIGGAPNLSTQRFARPDDARWDGAGRAALWMAERLAISLPLAVYIEAPVPHGGMKGKTNSRTLGLLNELATGCAAICKARRVPVYPANVSTIRAWFLGQGNMRGDDAKREAYRVATMIGWEPKNHDEADAAAGFHWACALHDRRLTAPPAHWQKGGIV